MLSESYESSWKTRPLAVRKLYGTLVLENCLCLSEHARLKRSEPGKIGTRLEARPVFHDLLFKSKNSVHGRHSDFGIVRTL